MSNAEQSLHQRLFRAPAGATINNVDVYLVVTEAAFGEFWSVTGVVFGYIWFSLGRYSRSAKLYNFPQEVRPRWEAR